MTIFAALLLLPLQTAPPQAATPAPVAGVDAERIAVAGQVARVTNSEALTTAQIDKMLNETFPKVFGGDPDMAALEKEYPGLIKALIAAVGPPLRAQTMRELPKLWERLAGVYARHFTTAELRELLGFYPGPAGTRLIAGVARSMDYSELMTDMMRNDTSVVTAEGMLAGQRAGVRGALQELTSEDRAQLVQFGLSETGRKIWRVTPELRAIVVAWSNEGTAAEEALIEKIAADTVTAFIGEKK